MPSRLTPQREQTDESRADQQDSRVAEQSNRKGGGSEVCTRVKHASKGRLPVLKG